MDSNNDARSSQGNVTVDCVEESPGSFVVSTLEDENDGDFSAGDLSLREAIALANEQSANTITFDDSLDGGTIAFNESLDRDITISDSLSINGLGQESLTLNGGFIFNVDADTDFALDKLNLTGSKVISSGNLTLSNSTISQTVGIGSADNSAIVSRGNATIVDSTIKDNNGGGNVGILFESGTATIERSAVTGNDSTSFAQSGIIVRSDATVDIINSTIANNRARSNGGIENAGTVKISNSTIANNSGGLSAGGINNFSGGTVTLTSSLLANNTGSANIGDISGDGEFISGGNNLISNGDDAGGFVDGVNGDLVGSNGDDPLNPQNDLLIDPQLGELQNNGGSTETLALPENSPAIDAGSNPNNLATDQRGTGFERTVGNGTDIGAVELQGNGGEPNELIVSTLEDENDGDFSEGDLSLREAIALSNQQEGADTITFENGLNGSIILSQGELSIEDSVTISGLGAENTIVDGNNSSRVFKIDDGNLETNIEVTIDGVTVANGLVAEETTYSVGGGILNQENLTIAGSVITGNNAEDPTEGVFTSRGGGIYTTGTTQIIDSTITGNDAIFGGGIYSLAATVNISDSEVENNYAGFVGGGLYSNDTELNLSNSTITGNESSFAYGGIGLTDSTGNISYSTVSDNIALNASTGGINLDNSQVDISYSTISGNAAQQGSGGGISVGNDSTANITNSTIANNNAGDNGGGINTALLSTTNITNSTISGNVAGDQGSGIYQRPDYFVQYDGSTIAGGMVTISSTIVAENGDNQDIDGDRLNSNGNNLLGNGDGIDGFVESDLVGTAGNVIDPQLGELQDNGGVTQMIALLENSPAVDAGSNPNNLAFDQRGADFERTIGNGTDIGAYEVQDSGGEVPDELVVSTLEDENDGDFSAGDLSLREAIVLANEQQGADHITFDEDLTGGTIVLDSALSNELTIDDSLSIAGLGQDNLTLEGSFFFKITQPDVDTDINGLNILGGKFDNSGTLNLANLTIAESFSIGTDGSAIISRGTLNVANSTIKDGRGGENNGILIESGNGNIERSLITNHEGVLGASGVIILDGATVDISNSTINNNRDRFAAGVANAGTVNITNSTIVDNGGLGGGGVANSGTASLTSSIIANNFSGSARGDVSGSGLYIDGGNNLIGNGDDATAFIDGVNGNIVGTDGDDPGNPQTNLLIDPKLGELQNNGGSTQTLALLSDSPAIDAGSNPNNFATDQRGVGFERTVGNGTDIGAFEVQTIIDDQDIVGTENSDRLEGTTAGDRIRGLNGDDFVRGLEGNDSIYGDGGNDRLDGNAGDDLISGGEGSDRLDGGDGADTMCGGSGDDLFRGGAGSDIYLYDLNANRGFLDRDCGASRRHRILDFNHDEDAIAIRSFAQPAAFDEFADLDTDGSGVLDSGDERIQIRGISTVIDFSDLFGRSHNSDTITLIGATNLDENNFLFNETVVSTEFG